MQMALTSQGRSVAALTGALAGNGTVTLDSAEISGLNPRAFEIAIRASDGGQVADDNRLRQLVEPALSAVARETRVQFERHGYFVADLIDHAPGAPVFNRAVTLRDSWSRPGG
jgi:hypothetical protein